MAQGANARGGRDHSLKKFIGTCSETGRDGWPKPDLLERARWGGARLSRSVDGQVRSGFAMLPAGSRRQPGCFLAQTVQAPFVFGGVRHRTLDGVTLTRQHPTTQPCVLAQVRLIERPFRSVDAARAANRYTPGARAGYLELPARAAQIVMVAGAARAYTREAAARPKS